MTSGAGKLTEFLELVKAGGWRNPPPVWNEEIRQSLSDRLITVGWGGVLKLTDAGRSALGKDGG